MTRAAASKRKVTSALTKSTGTRLDRCCHQGHKLSYIFKHIDFPQEEPRRKPEVPLIRLNPNTIKR